MLEQQQQQLVNGLRVLYLRAINNQGWAGPPLKDAAHGFPLTHDILSCLGALKTDARDSCDHFEEDFDTLKRTITTRSEGTVTPTAENPALDFSSSHTSKTERHSPQLFADEPLLSLASIASTRTDQGPTEQPVVSFPATSLSLNPAFVQAQYQTSIQPLTIHDIEMDFLASYSNFELVQEKLSPCLPLSPMSHWHDMDFGASNYETTFS